MHILPKKIKAYAQGFTLIELLVVIGILTVLFIITLIAINPGAQIAKVKNSTRGSDTKAINNAIQQWSVDNSAALPPSLNGTPYPTAAPGYEISYDAINICSALIPAYIAQLPRDPDIGGGSIKDCTSNYRTAYFVYKQPSQNRTVVYASASAAIAISQTPASTPTPTPTISVWSYDLRFNGNGTGDIDRVKIPIDPATTADVGATDFTIEFWLKAAYGENISSSCTPGGDNWVNGNSILNRDNFGAGDYGDYGISMYGSKIAFGVANSSIGSTICSNTTVGDNNWHHIAVTRKLSNGQLTIFIDGVLDAQANGPTGDISYHDSRSTSYPNSDPYLVIGAEKHDYDALSYPSFKGQIDELRISNTLRYTVSFSRASVLTPFTADGNTRLLYHFNEGSGTSAVDSSGNSVTGTIKVGGSPTGPLYFVSTVQ